MVMMMSSWLVGCLLDDADDPTPTHSLAVVVAVVVVVVVVCLVCLTTLSNNNVRYLLSCLFVCLSVQSLHCSLLFSMNH